MLINDNKTHYTTIVHTITNVNNLKHSLPHTKPNTHLQLELQCKYTTSKCVCQEFLLNIFTINFRKTSNILTINNLAQQRHNYNSRSKRAN